MSFATHDDKGKPILIPGKANVDKAMPMRWIVCGHIQHSPFDRSAQLFRMSPKASELTNPREVVYRCAEHGGHK